MEPDERNSRYAEMVAGFDAEFGTAWIREVISRFTELQPRTNHREAYERLLRSLLRMHGGPFHAVLRNARELEKPAYRKKLPLKLPLSAILLDAVTELDASAYDAAADIVKSELAVGPHDFSALYDRVRSTLATRGTGEMHAATAAAYAIVKKGRSRLELLLHEAPASIADVPGSDSESVDVPQETEHSEPLDEVGQVEVHSRGSVGWTQVLEVLGKVAPEDSLWDHVDELIDELRSTAARQIGIRTAATENATLREALLAQLAGVHARLAEFAREFAYLRRTPPAYAEGRDVAAIKSTVATLESFASALAALRDARGMPAETAEEEDERSACVGRARGLAIEALALVAPVTRDSTSEISALIDVPTHEEVTTRDSAQSVPTTAVDIVWQGSVPTATSELVPTPDRAPSRDVAPPADTPPAVVVIQPPLIVMEQRDLVEEPALKGSRSTRDARPRSESRRVVNSVLPLSSNAALISLGKEEQLFWRFVANGDVAAAYLYAEAQKALGLVLPASGVLAVLQGSRWLTRGNVRAPLAGELADRVRAHTFGTTDEEMALALSAALAPALSHPETELRGWLHVQGPIAAPVQTITDAVVAFADFGYALSPALLGDLTSEAERQRTLHEARLRLREWQRDAPSRTTKFARATRIWQGSLRRDLDKLLRDIGDERADHAEAAESKLTRWARRDFVEREIDKRDASIRGPGHSPVDFGAKEQLFALVSEAVEVGAQVEELRKLQTRGDWIYGRARQLQLDVRAAYPTAARELSEFVNSGDPAASALARVLQESLTDVLRALRLPTPDDCDRWSSRDDFDQIGVAALEKSAGLEHALGRRLLWCHGGMPPVRGPQSVADAKHLAQALEVPFASTREACLSWLSRRRFDRVEELRACCNDSDLDRQIEQARSAAAEELEPLLTQRETELERGVIDGYVGDERAELSASLASIVPTETLNVESAWTTLESVRDRLAELRREHVERTRARWLDLEKRLHAHMEPAKVNEHAYSILRALGTEDLRAADEAIFQLEERLLRRSDAPEARLRGTTGETIAKFRTFDREYEALFSTIAGGLGGLIKGLERRTTGFDSITLPADEERLDAVAKALRSWLQLKNQVPDNLCGPVGEVLSYCGFNLRDGATSVIAGKRARTWREFHVDMNDGGHCPIPQFGSLSRAQYHVVCVWERPGADTIASIFNQMARRPSILLYLGRFSDAQRAGLRNGARQHELALLSIDESLIAFLAGEQDLRLPALFDCTLPYAMANPYTPFQAGDVPPEMFFGRRDIATQLTAASGSCILFGGRQLGKSALLRKIQREFHDPARSHYAIVIDVKHIGDARAGVDTLALWGRLRDELHRLELLPKTRLSDDPERLKEAIRTWCTDREDRRLLVLLDEADNMLDMDSRDDFKVVDNLRELMASTSRRFKVVLAGLHNVQRFQSLPNQPLAHFGQAIEVGPLEPRDAMDLVEKPLAALGYKFEDENDVLRILSYTNYHPGLIQLFCHELLRLLQSKVASGQPPLFIKRDQVEAVYLKEHVREGIRERFDWTLALDTRYQAVAWALILDQREHGGSTRAFPLSRILDLARTWWPRGFESGLDELKGILDEMRGLGVLVRSEQGYRLRSPNVVRLIGDVETRLLELSDKMLPSPFDAAQHHRLLGNGSGYSPLTFADERRVLGAEKSGLALLFGSRALGLDNVDSALQALAISPHAGGSTVLESVPTNRLDGELREWLAGFVERNAASGRLIAIVPLVAEGFDPLLLASIAQRFCADRRKKEQVVRVVLLLSPGVTQRWMIAASHELTENQASALVCIKKWTRAGLATRLEHASVMDPDGRTREELLAVTGGWSVLVEQVFAWSDGHDLRPTLERMKNELADASSQVRRSFLRDLEVPLGPEDSLLRTIVDVAGRDAFAAEHLPMFQDSAVGIPDDARFMAAIAVLERVGILERSGSNLSVDPIVVRALKTEVVP